MLRRTIVIATLMLLALVSAGDVALYAATCTPSGKGVCHACKNCRYCAHCSKRGGTCSVCR